MAGGMSQKNMQAVRDGGAALIRQDDILAAVDWKSLSHAIGRDVHPKGRSGKGVNVFASHLLLEALNLPPDTWVGQTDSEIAEFDEYACFEHLFAAARKDKDPGSLVHLKMAKPGRNNMTTKAMISSLKVLSELGNLSLDVRQFCDKVRKALSADPWMLTGEWISRWKMMRNRPLMSRYCEETLQAIWSVMATECGFANVRYVKNVIPRLDGANTATKEEIMMSVLSQFIVAVILFGKPPHKWSLNDIEDFNSKVMPKIDDFTIIGEEDQPVEVISFDPQQVEFVIPSVATCVKNNWVDLESIQKTAMFAGIQFPKNNEASSTKGTKVLNGATKVQSN
jgi:hypothetical protein